MRIVLIIIVILFSSCRSSAEMSFDNLKGAFVDWYFRYHPVEAMKYNINLNGHFQLNTKLEIDEYYADVSRFLIELSQIDITKISDDARLEYDILYSKLNQIQFIYDVIRPWEWNPLWELDKLYESLYIISQRDDISMDDRVISIKNRLTRIPQFLENSKSLKTKFSKLHSEYTDNKINNILLLLKQLPLKLNSDNITLDKIDLLINKSILALENYKVWNSANISNLEKIKFPIDILLLDKGFQLFASRYYKPDITYRMARKKLITTQNKMFLLSLPAYLEENDEPVWLDREDTLEVVRWTMNKIYKEPDNKIKSNEVLSTFYSSLVNIEQFCFKNLFFSSNNNKRARLEFAPEYGLNNNPIYIFDNHPKDFSRELIYNIKLNEDLGVDYDLIKQEIDILNVININPGYASQLGYAQKNLSMIRYLFPDLITQYGWQLYSLNTLIGLGYGDEKHQLLKLNLELVIIAMAIIENKYYSGQISRSEVYNYISEMVFLKKNKIDLIQKKIDLNYFSGTLSFIGFMELNSLKIEYKRKHEGNFILSDFHDLILSDGVIPISYLKKKF